jgi:hypothetical protein
MIYLFLVLFGPVYPGLLHKLFDVLPGFHQQRIVNRQDVTEQICA